MLVAVVAVNLPLMSPAEFLILLGILAGAIIAIVALVLHHTRNMD